MLGRRPASQPHQPHSIGSPTAGSQQPIKSRVPSAFAALLRLPRLRFFRCSWSGSRSSARFGEVTGLGTESFPF